MPLAYNIDYIPDEFLRKAEIELGETAEKKLVCLEKFRKLIEGNKNIPSWLTDNMLLIFLRARKFDVDRAFSSLINCFQLKFAVKEYGTTFHMDMQISVCKNSVMTMLPYRDDNGCPIILFKIINFDTEKFKVMDLLATGAYFAASTLFFHPATQICGGKAILDCRGLTMNQVLHIRLGILRFMYKVLSKTFPIRVKEVHVLCDSSIILNIWKITKPFMSKKLQQRILIYGPDISKLHNHFKDELLPEEYGGNAAHDEAMNIGILEKFWETDIAKILFDMEH